MPLPVAPRWHVFSSASRARSSPLPPLPALPSAALPPAADVKVTPDVSKAPGEVSYAQVSCPDAQHCSATTCRHQLLRVCGLVPTRMTSRLHDPSHATAAAKPACFPGRAASTYAQLTHLTCFQTHLQAAAEHGEAAQTKAGESAEAGKEAAGEAVEVRLTSLIRIRFIACWWHANCPALNVMPPRHGMPLKRAHAMPVLLILSSPTPCQAMPCPLLPEPSTTIPALPADCTGQGRRGMGGGQRGRRRGGRCRRARRGRGEGGGQLLRDCIVWRSVALPSNGMTRTCTLRVESSLTHHHAAISCRCASGRERLQRRVSTSVCFVRAAFHCLQRQGNSTA